MSFGSISIEVDVDIDDIINDISDSDLKNELDKRARKSGSKLQKRKGFGSVYDIQALTMLDTKVLDEVQRLVSSPCTDKNILLSILEKL